jgi:hypothetical protein
VTSPEAIHAGLPLGCQEGVQQADGVPGVADAGMDQRLKYVADGRDAAQAGYERVRFGVGEEVLYVLPEVRLVVRGQGEADGE